MKRTTVFADEDDLAVIKEAAARLGVAEAELIREAIHLVAISHRTWDQPFFTRTYSARAQLDPVDAAQSAWDDKADSYEKTRNAS